MRARNSVSTSGRPVLAPAGRRSNFGERVAAGGGRGRGPRAGSRVPSPEYRVPSLESRVSPARSVVEARPADKQVRAGRRPATPCFRSARPPNARPLALASSARRRQASADRCYRGQPLAGRRAPKVVARSALPEVRAARARLALASARPLAVISYGPATREVSRGEQRRRQQRRKLSKLMRSQR